VHLTSAEQTLYCLRWTDGEYLRPWGDASCWAPNKQETHSDTQGFRRSSAAAVGQRVKGHTEGQHR